MELRWQVGEKKFSRWHLPDSSLIGGELEIKIYGNGIKGIYPITNVSAFLSQL